MADDKSNPGKLDRERINVDEDYELNGWAKSLGVKSVYILHDTETYGKGIADVFETEAKKLGLEVLGNEGIDYKQPDQKPVLTKIRASGADLGVGLRTVARPSRSFECRSTSGDRSGPSGSTSEPTDR